MTPSPLPLPSLTPPLTSSPPSLPPLPYSSPPSLPPLPHSSPPSLPPLPHFLPSLTPPLPHFLPHFLPTPHAVPDDTVVTITSSGLSMAGNNLTLICNVTLRQALRTTPSIEWVGPDGAIGGVSDVTISMTSESGVSVMFVPLHTSHGGEYRCVANITVPQVTITASSAYDITVQSQSLQPAPHTHTSHLTPPLPSLSPTPYSGHHGDSCGRRISQWPQPDLHWEGGV